MFSVNFAKFVRTRFIKKTAGTLEIHKDSHNEQHEKITLKMRLKKFLGDLDYWYVKTRSF